MSYVLFEDVKSLSRVDITPMTVKDLANSHPSPQVKSPSLRDFWFGTVQSVSPNHRELQFCPIAAECVADDDLFALFISGEQLVHKFLVEGLPGGGAT